MFAYICSFGDTHIILQQMNLISYILHSLNVFFDINHWLLPVLPLCKQTEEHIADPPT